MSARFPVVTYAAAAAILAVAYFVTGFFPTEASLSGVAWSRDAWAAGDWSALAWSIFAHGGIVHLAVNLMALLSFGPAVERALGPARFALVYLGAGAAGNFAHVLLGPDVPVVGASGALFGLLGVLLLVAPLAEVALLGVVPMPLLLASAFYVAAVPTLMGFSDVLPVAHEAHLGGMAFGVACALAVAPAKALRVLPAAGAVFAASWVGVAYAIELDYAVLWAADAMGVASLLWPLALAALVLGAAFWYLSHLEKGGGAASASRQ